MTAGWSYVTAIGLVLFVFLVGWRVGAAHATRAMARAFQRYRERHGPEVEKILSELWGDVQSGD